MTAPSPHGRPMLARLACLTLAFACAPLAATTAHPRSLRTGSRAAIAPVHSGDSPYDRALRLREALGGRPEGQRTRRDYDRVLDAFRGVYHGNPRDPHADASVAAVAELLAEQGRLFEERKASLDAIGEYEFLRRAYPGSPRRLSALLTEAEIYRRDLEDAADARQAFASFLKLYPRSALAAEAREGLRGVSGTPAEGARRNTVLDAALGSRAGGVGTGMQRRDLAHPGVGLAAASGRTSESPRSQTRDLGHPVLSGKDTLVERDLGTGPVPNGEVTGGDVASAGRARPTDLGREPTPVPARSEAALNATPPPRHGQFPLVTGVRHWSTPVYTRVAIDLEDEVQYEASRAPNPDRIFFDLHGAKLSPELIGKAVTVTDGGYLKRIRAAQFSGDVVRVVLDVSDVSDYSAFFLPNPARLIIDIHGNAHGAGRTMERAATSQPAPLPPHETGPAPTVRTASSADANVNPTRQARLGAVPQAAVPPQASSAATPTRTALATRSAVQSNTVAGPTSGGLGEIASLDRQPDTVRATRQPTTAPVSVSVAGSKPALEPSTPTPVPDPANRRSRVAAAPRTSLGNTPADASAPAIHAAAPTAAGERSMVRALGLKIGRIVVDAGHGGHDSGTLGPGGIEEKDVVLDVALRLGKLLKQRLGADVIYTRDDDTFIPLETRTAIANKTQADLFISVHANSSPDASARGVETYYLNFTTSADALEVAARENAVSDQSIHQLSDLVKKITLQDKIAESREFASDVEQTLYSGLEAGNPGLKDRGVKKAPFVVLIGANMPSILAEISFLTNPDDARQLRDPEYRQRIAEALYRGVAKYIGSLSGVRLAQGGGSPAGQ